MGVSFARKAFEDATQRRTGPSESIQLDESDKFALRAFNRLAHDREISGPFAASMLTNLPEYYNPKRSLKKLLLPALCT